MIIKYANIIERSPSALNMKIGNFGRLDPELRKVGITGLVHGAHLEEEIWNEFHGNWDKLAYESELLIAKYQNKDIEEIENIEVENLPLGKERQAIVKIRINQSFFRSTILSAYNSQCCITGLSVADLLVASHIAPWAVDEINRVNPRNGLCLNAIHDKAFDKGYITVTPDYSILISEQLQSINDPAVDTFFKKYQNKKILLPDKFLPAREFLEFHNQQIFKK